METAVRRYIDTLSAESRCRVSALFEQEIGEFALLVSEMTAALQQFHAQHPRYEVGDPKQVAFALMTKGANTLMASFELAVVGYMSESEILLRSALERFAVAWDVVHNPDRFSLWAKGKKFNSTDSISRLKSEVGPIGKLYGYLSNTHVHTSTINSSPSMFFDGDDKQFQFFGYLSPGREHLAKGKIYFCLFCAYVLLQLTELVFFRYCEHLETIEHIADEDRVRTVVSERHRKFVDTASQYFKLMAEDPAATLR